MTRRSHDRRTQQSSRVLFGVTAPGTALAFLRGQLGWLAAHGVETHLVCADTADEAVSTMAAREETRFHRVSIGRDPSVIGDLKAMRSVVDVVRAVRPGIVVAGTPKMSLLLLLAAFLLRVPRRVYLCHGLRFEGYRGAQRGVLVVLELALSRLAHEVVAVSPSVRRELVRIGVSPNRVVVLGSGSANGIDLARFSVTTPQLRLEARARWRLSAGDDVVAFVARLTGDKGIDALLHCARELPTTQFLVAGPPEPRGDADRSTLHQLRRLENVHLLKRVSKVESVYWASDVLLLPTRREGLGVVALEAGACGIPTLAYRATGIVDAVLHGETGRIVSPGDVETLSRELRQMLASPDDRAAMGSKARRHACENYRNEVVWAHWVTFLERRQ